MGFIKVSVDASINDYGFKTGCGGVARNNAGDFIFGFSQKLELCTVLEAELLAIHHGIALAVDRGKRHLVVDSDSQEAIQLLVASVNSQHSLSLVLLMGYLVILMMVVLLGCPKCLGNSIR